MLPRAELARVAWLRRAARWLQQRLDTPPSMLERDGFDAATHWAVTGALAAGFGIGFYVFVVTGELWHADLTRSLGWAVFSLLGVACLYLPFLISLVMYLPLSRHRWFRRRAVAAGYGAAWHLSAHCLLIASVGGNPRSAAVAVPIVIGALWGSWLPGTVASPPGDPEE
jgi:hypothetical protein